MVDFHYNRSRKKWHTEEEHITDNNGNIRFKGFYGKYDIEIETDGKIITKEIELYKKGKNKFEITL